MNESPLKILTLVSLKSGLAFFLLFSLIRIPDLSREITQSKIIMSALIAIEPEVTKKQWKDMSVKIMSKINLYESQIERDHLVDGMVVHRNADGTPNHICDSLLFSSLRFVALKKLGLDTKASDAWEAIRNSRNGTFWLRHPKCKQTPTSRDMIIGLATAFSQQPKNYDDEMYILLSHLKSSNGFISNSPPYVSYVTPSLGEALRRMPLKNYNRSSGNQDYLHFNGKTSFSTLELDVLVIPEGYPTHLLGLLTWLEMEVNKIHKTNGTFKGTRSVTWELGKLFKPFTYDNIFDQRLEWVSHGLVELNPQNLFFQYLKLKSQGNLNPKTRYKLLDRLLSMKQFPDDRLPMNCDRNADYLWQRPPREYQIKNAYSGSCTVKFAGVDFLWMASLLLENTPISSLKPKNSEEEETKLNRIYNL